MGLDMYAYATKAKIKAVDFREPGDSEDLCCWRNHFSLHCWMEQLYRSKGGSEERFNCVSVRIDPIDLDALERVVTDDALPVTGAGMFIHPTNKRRNFEFIRSARDAFKKGKNIYFTSSW